MDWSQILAIIGTNAALFFWARSESRSDIRHLDVRLDAIRELTHAIHLENKDFHNRLYNIEKDKTK
jgi:hypothetical protein